VTLEREPSPARGGPRHSLANSRIPRDDPRLAADGSGVAALDPRGAEDESRPAVGCTREVADDTRVVPDDPRVPVGDTRVLLDDTSVVPGDPRKCLVGPTNRVVILAHVPLSRSSSSLLTAGVEHQGQNGREPLLALRDVSFLLLAPLPLPDLHHCQKDPERDEPAPPAGWNGSASRNSRSASSVRPRKWASSPSPARTIAGVRSAARSPRASASSAKVVLGGPPPRGQHRLERGQFGVAGVVRGAAGEAAPSATAIISRTRAASRSVTSSGITRNAFVDGGHDPLVAQGIPSAERARERATFIVATDLRAPERVSRRPG